MNRFSSLKEVHTLSTKQAGVAILLQPWKEKKSVSNSSDVTCHTVVFREPQSLTPDTLITVGDRTLPYYV